MSINQDRINYLLTQWLGRNITAAELNELSEVLMEGKYDPQVETAFQSFIHQLPNEGFGNYKESDWEHLYQRIIQTPSARVINMVDETVKHRMFNWRRIAVAASIIIIIAVGLVLSLSKDSKQDQPIVQQPTDVEAPKLTKAMITLANGNIVFLDSADAGQLATQEGVNITKLADGKIVYNGSATEMVYNTLSNPRGSKVIDITLSDGSRVWLNAGSSVTYPVAFVGNERKVSITGEAYFEVAHNTAMPFKVTKGEMEITVLGTHFNVNAYDDEDAIRITLLEGKVKVTNTNSRLTTHDSRVLKPGEQALVTNDSRLTTQNSVDLDAVMAWKNGSFQFNNTSIDAIMRQVARWYDVDVVFETTIKERLNGTIPRDVSATNLFKILELTGKVHFRIEGRKVIVMQ